jgi:mRNA interferase HicA
MGIAGKVGGDGLGSAIALLKQAEAQSCRRWGRVSASKKLIDVRTYMSEYRGMTGKELVKALQKLSKARKEELRIESKRGKGSHITLYLGGQYAVIPDLKKELGFEVQWNGKQG